MEFTLPSESKDAFISRLAKVVHSQLFDLHGVDRVALLDFPDHANIGDSAIYCGELAYFDANGITPTYVCTANNFSQSSMDSVIGDAPILLHGGGNFGSVWPWIHAFRERLISSNQGRTIIQLPQTIHFDNEAALDRTARIIEGHGNFILLVRDHRSFDLARKKFQCEVRLCPDMAFAMGQLQRRAAQYKYLINLREDHEASGDYDTDILVAREDIVRRDWPQETSYIKSRLLGSNFIRRAQHYLRGGTNASREYRYRELAERRVERGIELLSRGEKVITNRLHGHILCYLMDIPHCVIDNSYGKTSSFMDAWGTGGGNVHRADTIEEAIAALA